MRINTDFFWGNADSILYILIAPSNPFTEICRSKKLLHD